MDVLCGDLIGRISVADIFSGTFAGSRCCCELSTTSSPVPGSTLLNVYIRQVIRYTQLGVTIKGDTEV